MDQDTLNKLKVEITQEALRKFIHDLVVTQEEVMFRKKKLASLNKKKESERSEQDKVDIRNTEVIIERYMEGIETSDSRIENFLAIIDAYSNNKPIKL